MRVVICEDLALLRDGLKRLLEDNGMEVVATVDRGDHFVSAAFGHKPDVCVVDVRLPPTFRDEGLRAALQAREQQPGLPVLILSQYVEHTYAAELLADGVGAVGYLLKDRVGDVDEFVAAVRKVAEGGTVLDPEVVAQILARRRSSALDDLTPREREVLALMAEGRSNQAVADALVVTARRGREACLEHLREARAAGERGGQPPRPCCPGVPARIVVNPVALRLCSDARLESGSDDPQMRHRVVILGAGTGGTLIANRLHRLYGEAAEIVVIDRDDRHIYQPGLLFVPFGLADPDEIVRSRGAQLRPGIDFRLAEVDRVEIAENAVHLNGGEQLNYDVLVVASGAALLPQETEGLTGSGWGRNVFTFYDLEGASEPA